MMYDQILKANVRGKICQTVRKSLAFVLSVHDIFSMIRKSKTNWLTLFVQLVLAIRKREISLPVGPETKGS